jgi:hypothetical protein
VLHSYSPVFAYPVFITLKVVVGNPEGFKELPKMMVGFLRVGGIQNNAVPELVRIAGYVKHNLKALVA